MGEPIPKPELGKELEAITGEKGAALVRFGDRTYVVVEVDSLPKTPSSTVYDVTDPEEAADLGDAAADADNPAFSTAEAMRHLQTLR